MIDRLTADDSETRLAALDELRDRAESDPVAAWEYAPQVAWMVDDDHVGRRAAAVLRTLAASDVVPPEMLAGPIAVHLDIDLPDGVEVRADPSTPEDDASMADLEATARLLRAIASERPAEATGVVDVLVGALEHDRLRPEAMRALYHLTRRQRPSVPVETVARRLDDPDPTVRADAAAVVAELAPLDGQSTHADTLAERSSDPHPDVRRVALTAFDRLGPNALGEVPPGRLHRLVEGVLDARETDEGDPDIRARVGSLHEKLSTAVPATVVMYATGTDTQWMPGTVDRAAAADLLVDVAAAHPEFAPWAAANIQYHTGDDPEVAARAEELCSRIVDRSDRFDSVEALRAAADDGGTVPPGALRALAAGLADA